VYDIDASDVIATRILVSETLSAFIRYSWLKQIAMVLFHLS